MREKGLLAGVFKKNAGERYIERRMDELGKLAGTAGIDVFESIVQRRDEIDPAYYMGKGKVEEIEHLAAEYGIDVIIVSVPLDPVQLRNLEAETRRRIIDRNELILIIFAKNARTNVSKVEAELAQYRYLLPRLTGRGIEMSRTGGGIGTRGPGEKKLETDRRKIRHQIDILKKKLTKYKSDHRQQRKSRSSVFNVSLVGYTNAGKTTLMNALTGNDFNVADQLFTTLDTTTRKLRKDIVITDTVGLLGELPHELISSFQLTLSEAANADLQLIVADISSPYCEEQIEEVTETLSQLEDEDNKPERIFVFNKTDMLISDSQMEYYSKRFDRSVFVSAKDNRNIDTLFNMILDRFFSRFNNIKITVKNEHYRIINFILNNAYIKNQEVRENSIYFDCYLNSRDHSKLLKMNKEAE
ncbi:MAG: GTPase HflX [bacterium]